MGRARLRCRLKGPCHRGERRCANRRGASRLLKWCAGRKERRGAAPRGDGSGPRAPGRRWKRTRWIAEQVVRAGGSWVAGCGLCKCKVMQQGPLGGGSPNRFIPNRRVQEDVCRRGARAGRQRALPPGAPCGAPASHEARRLGRPGELNEVVRRAAVECHGRALWRQHLEDPQEYAGRRRIGRRQHRLAAAGAAAARFRRLVRL